MLDRIIIWSLRLLTPLAFIAVASVYGLVTG